MERKNLDTLFNNMTEELRALNLKTASVLVQNTSSSYDSFRDALIKLQSTIIDVSDEVYKFYMDGSLV